MKSLDQIELFGPEMRDDPYPVYERLRNEAPIYWDARTNSWYLSRYRDVVLGLTDLRFSADRAEYMQKQLGNNGLQQFFFFLNQRMLFKDPPTHTHMRAIVSNAFKPHIIEGLAGHIQNLVDGFLAQVQNQGKMDVVRDLAYPLPTTVIAELVGIPPEDRDNIRAWSDEFVTFFSRPPASLTVADYERASSGARNLTTYLKEYVDRVRQHPEHNLLSMLEQAEESGGQLTEEQVFSNAVLILAAGHETTTSLITNGTLALLRHPDQFEKLKQDLSLLPHAIEEFLRYDPPVQFTHRLAKEDIELEGQRIKKGQLVHLLLASANRDPEKFPNPEQFDITRTDNHHVSFGMGAHFCLGAALARLEATIAFRTMLTRMPNMQLAADKLQYRALSNLRRVESLPVVF